MKKQKKNEIDTEPKMNSGKVVSKKPFAGRIYPELNFHFFEL
jgi:hypothetical protein